LRPRAGSPLVNNRTVNMSHLYEKAVPLIKPLIPLTVAAAGVYSLNFLGMEYCGSNFLETLRTQLSGELSCDPAYLGGQGSVGSTGLVPTYAVPYASTMGHLEYGPALLGLAWCAAVVSALKWRPKVDDTGQTATSGTEGVIKPRDGEDRQVRWSPFATKRRTELLTAARRFRRCALSKVRAKDSRRLSTRRLEASTTSLGC
jgi:hypothetical protein